MSDEPRIIPLPTLLVQRVRDTQDFLKMAAIELRRLAEREPDVAGELLHIANQLEAEAEDCRAVLPDGLPSACAEPN